MRQVRHIFFFVGVFFMYVSTLMCQTDTLLIDFGSDPSPYPWHNIPNARYGTLTGLSNDSGYTTNIGITVYDAFNGVNLAGTSNPAPGLGYPATATGDSFFGNTILFSGYTEPTGGVKLTGLNPQKLYIIDLFASRTATDNRETQYILTGQNIDTLRLNVSSNNSLTVRDTLYPATDSTISINASPGPANNNSYGFFYLGAMKVTYDHEPPIGPTFMTLTSPNGGEYWQAGKTPDIMWQSNNVAQIIIEYSTDNGNLWQIIDTVPGSIKQYPWTVPSITSSLCLVRLRSYAFTDISAAPFTIAIDTVNCNIVVLGSSTAAGAGVSAPDSSWVNRYKRTLFQHNTRYEVTNLAMGGYTTYHILPNGTPIPTGVSITIDTLRNLTHALTFGPYAIIINMPSNDAGSYFGADKQMENFNTIYTAAAAAGVQTWICSVQPRNFSNQAQIDIQLAMVDTLPQIYGTSVIDFWNGFADPNGHILGMYDSGDGVHMNDVAHNLLAQRVLQKHIDTISCAPLVVCQKPINKKEPIVTVYPNPFESTLHINFEGNQPEKIFLKLTDINGRLIDSFTNDKLSKQTSEIIWTPSFKNSGTPTMLFLHFVFFSEGEWHNVSQKLIKY